MTSSEGICKILRRQGESVDDDFEPTYSLSDSIDYIFKAKATQQMREELGLVAGGIGGVTPVSIDIDLSGVLIIADEVLPEDRILLDGWEYDIIPGGIIKRMVAFSNEVEYYVIAISRRREYNETTVTITSKVD